jgi:hypothetical protein
MGFLKDIKNKIKGVEKQEEINLLLSKKEKLIILFKDEEDGFRMPVEAVLLQAGIKTDGALRTYISELKRDKELYIYQKFGFVYRGKK